MSVYRGAREIFIGSDDLGELFSGHKKAFIVSDPFMVENHMTNYMTDKLEARGIETQVYSEVGSDPSIELVAKGVSVISEAKPDLIIAFGGGSAIDLCKAMMFFAQKQGLVDDAKFVVVPTTSGTGSEVTDFSVITDTEKEIKYPLVDRALMPDAAILDCELTKSVPPAFTAATGMDAITHAVESYISNMATPLTEYNAIKGLQILYENLPKVVADGSDMDAREQMMLGCIITGFSFSNANLGFVHAIAHTLSAHFGLAHGMANACVLPYVMAYNAEACPEKMVELAKAIGLTPSGDLEKDKFLLSDALLALCRKLGIKTLKEQNVPEDAFDRLSDDVLKEPVLGFNPRQGVTKEDVIEILKKAY